MDTKTRIIVIVMTTWLVLRLPEILKSNNKIEDGKQVQRPNKIYTIIYWSLIGFTLIFAFFSIIGIMSSISTGSLKVLSIIFAAIAFIILELSLFFKKNLIKAFYLEEQDHFIIGNSEKTTLVYYNGIDKVVKDDGRYVVYFNNCKDKINLPRKIFTTTKLTAYIKLFFEEESRTAFKTIYTRKDLSKIVITGSMKD